MPDQKLTAATDPLTLLLRDHGIGAPDILADAIRQDFVVIARSACPATQYGMRNAWDPEVIPLGTDLSMAGELVAGVVASGVEVGFFSRPLLPEIPWEVDPGTAEGVSSGSVANGGQESASGIGGAA